MVLNNCQPMPEIGTDALAPIAFCHPIPDLHIPNHFIYKSTSHISPSNLIAIILLEAWLLEIDPPLEQKKLLNSIFIHMRNASLSISRSAVLALYTYIHFSFIFSIAHSSFYVHCIRCVSQFFSTIKFLLFGYLLYIYSTYWYKIIFVSLFSVLLDSFRWDVYLCTHCTLHIVIFWWIHFLFFNCFRIFIF